MKRLTAALLLLLTAAQCTACASAGGDEAKTDEMTAGETTAAVEETYDFGTLDLGGEDFTILNAQEIRELYNILDVEEPTGDLLDDAVWKRNNLIEEKYNITIVEEHNNDPNGHLRSTVLAGEDLYNASYTLTNTLGSMILDGMFHDLKDGEGFQFDQPWWDHAVMDGAAIGEDESLYFISSNMNLYAFEGTWCMYFNKRMCSDLQLDTPYALVEEGKWTLDRLYEYTSVGANLNGEMDWSWNQEAKSVYGFSSMTDFILQMYTSCEQKVIDIEEGEPVLRAGTDRFYTVTDKLVRVFGEKGTSHFCDNNRGTGNHYENIFAANRAFFIGAEIKGGDGGGRFADMTDDYGIVPMPKFDEAQEEYISPVALWAYFMTVPVTHAELDTSSKILDAMSYVSYRDIVPVYYDIVLQVKNIRDEETSDMLDIISSTRTYLTAYAFGWGANLRSDINNMLRNGENNAASIVAKHESAIAKEFADALNTYAENANN
ncbi:MAG: hypothetical protein E7604_11025 [Ruminococcaceae bacterium]|nr:hypothetical protein [Oscillospiraceae bacterium]